MRLSHLLKGIVSLVPKFDQEVEGLSLNSHEIEPGSVFVALQGTRHHGLEFAEQAIRLGAVCVLTDKLDERELGVPLIYVDDLAGQLPLIAARFYHNPSHKMDVIGVTGTNGKTSVSQFLAQSFGSRGDKAGVLGTLGYGLLNDLEPASHTTPDILRVQSYLFGMKTAGANVVAMEVSSHALDQNRVARVRFTTAVFTNFSRDHLDYHGSMETYWAAKQKLFMQPELALAVVNMEDEKGRQLVDTTTAAEVWAYGMTRRPELNANQVVASNLQHTQDGLVFDITTTQGSVSVHVPLMGDFNLENALATATVLIAKRWSLSEVKVALSQLQPPLGRMQLIHTADHCATVIIDFAHTPDALAKVLKNARAHAQGSLWVVFGCGGDRDQGKRPQMGRIAEQLADFVVLTDDNPRSESPGIITQQILAGIQAPDQVEVIHDRSDAVFHAMANAEVNDIVVLAGKGHENYQLYGDIREPYSDHLAVQKACARLSQ